MRIFHWIDRYAIIYGLFSALLGCAVFFLAAWQTSRNVEAERDVLLVEELVHFSSKLENETVNSRSMGAAIFFGQTNPLAKLSVLGKLPPNSPQILSALDELRNLSQNELAYLADRDGVVTASISMDPVSLAGTEMSFRPYLQLAMQGIPSIYPAVGIASNNKRGIFLAAPVRAGMNAASMPVGAVVIRINAEKIDGWLKNWSGGPAYLLSPQGVVFASSRPDWLFRLDGPADQLALKHIRESRQFGSTFDQLPPVSLPFERGANESDVDGHHYVMQSHPLEWNDPAGNWKLVLLDKRNPWWAQWEILALAGLAGLITLLLLFWLRTIARNSVLQHEIHRNLAIAAATFDSRQGVLITDEDTTIIRVNQAFTEITGYDSAEAVGNKPTMLSSGIQDAAFYARMWDEIATHGGWSGEIWNRRKNGEVYPEHLTVTPIFDNNGKVVNYVGIFSDITQRKATEQEILNLAFYDTLTGLPNRRLLNERLEHAMASGKREGCHGALMFMDIDKFKQLNDTHGHGMGDLLLVEVARRISNCVREADTVARFGGDEFVVLLNRLDVDEGRAMEHAAVVAEKIRATLSEPYMLTLAHDSTPPVTVTHQCSSSIGVVLFRGHSASAEEILKWADIAMYQAKADGRNAVHFHHQQADALVRKS